MKLKTIFRSILLENILQDVDSMIFYHGTNADKEWEDLKIQSTAGDYGEGLYLTTNRRYAERHGNRLLSGKVDPKRPVLIGSKEYNEDIYPEIANGGVPTMWRCSEIARKKGYDSIVIDRNIDDIWIVLLENGLLRSIK